MQKQESFNILLSELHVIICKQPHPQIYCACVYVCVCQANTAIFFKITADFFQSPL